MKMQTMNKLVLITVIAGMALTGLRAQTIHISTFNTSLVYKVDKDGTVKQCFYGNRISTGIENIQVTALDAYPAFGKAYINQPAFRATHADGNLTTELTYVSHETKNVSPGINLTRIVLKDRFYDLSVSLFFKAYEETDIIEQWTEISHNEKKDITLRDFASAQLAFNETSYWLTSFYGNWAAEMNMQEEKLNEGIKTIDSKAGVRVNQSGHACFLLGLNQSAAENSGTVVGGTLAWPGSWSMTFEVDAAKHLRAVSGINAFASSYSLRPKEVFKTPALLYTISHEGTGLITRRFHSWAREHGIYKGERPRLSLLNNWEATYFDFDEKVLKQIIGDASGMGFDLFLLDDGWFGNKYPRNNDQAGLGDWEVNKLKLPNGIGALVKEAEDKEIKFGIWIEPEMVNPKSELYEKHPDWVITAPNRELDLSRNQLVLDLSNPAVQEHVFSVVDKLLTANPAIAYLKWDCNRYMTNVGSKAQPADKQSHLYVKYVEGLFKVLDRVRAKYKDVYMMACSGGGGRIDYGTMKYFDEYWISDNTDALDRIFIQWGTTYFFPAMGLASHVSVTPNHITGRTTPLKFRFDVALAAKLGMDLQPKDMSEADREYSRNAIKLYRDIKHIVQFGDLYRLLSPYTGNRAALMYATRDKQEALVFSYLLKKQIYSDDQVLYLKGLDPVKLYTLREINKTPGQHSRLADLEGKKYTGEFLMKYGVRFPMYNEFESIVFQVTGE
jgi:alpha-galactosidase